MANLEFLFICMDHPNTQNKLWDKLPIPAGNFNNLILFINHGGFPISQRITNGAKSHQLRAFKTTKMSYVLPLPQETLRARHCSKSMVLSDPKMSCVDQKCPHRWRLPQCLSLVIVVIIRNEQQYHHIMYTQRSLEFMGHVDTSILYNIYNVGKDGLANTP